MQTSFHGILTAGPRTAIENQSHRNKDNVDSVGHSSIFIITTVDVIFFVFNLLGLSVRHWSHTQAWHACIYGAQYNIRFV